jgi:predicted hotdog family 3-hydroxylacyl-ACP dehydratase
MPSTPFHLPHASLMRWLPDDALAPDAVHVTVPPDHPFLRDGHLLPAALIEYLAQAAAAMFSTTAQNRRLRQGVLVAITDFNADHPVPVGTPLTLRVTPEKSFGPFTSAHLTAHHYQTPIASAHMTFHLTFE